MSARGVLIKPWLFREVNEGYRDLSAEERVAIYRRYVDAGARTLGRRCAWPRARPQFTRWHIDFWHRYVPRRETARYPSIQVRETEHRHAHAARCASSRGRTTRPTTTWRIA